ncbi:thiol-disulfide oxidoreductase DCC family protein [Paenibacillus cymbidii]|uniref:thiol-disulfide oxidoreductase DCC family protein n=1 Tax=Paenibacillus cymbidii TaxID=1639034 RepID=UPI00107FE414|nr:DUF393 domain-containing protein [Paenibacillus cymbidii]
MKEQLTVLYDETCVLCRRTVDTLGKLRTTAKLVMLPLQSAPSAMLPAGYAREELLAQLHVIDEDGRLYRGADAIFRIMRSVPSLRFVAPLYRIPGMKPLADSIYRIVAKHRYRLFGQVGDDCSSGSCKLHQGKHSEKTSIERPFEDERPRSTPQSED